MDLIVPAEGTEIRVISSTEYTLFASSISCDVVSDIPILFLAVAAAWPLSSGQVGRRILSTYETESAGNDRKFLDRIGWGQCVCTSWYFVLVQAAILWSESVRHVGLQKSFLKGARVSLGAWRAVLVPSFLCAPRSLWNVPPCPLLRYSLASVDSYKNGSFCVHRTHKWRRAVSLVFQGITIKACKGNGREAVLCCGLRRDSGRPRPALTQLQPCLLCSVPWSDVI